SCYCIESSAAITAAVTLQAINHATFGSTRFVAVWAAPITSDTILNDRY
ncbi:MAG: hypothetical protein HQL83_04385, partial [Magnetococcales bacterium]|nr:hypothetical protein [Magnetococcales bacterium]